MKRGDTHPGGMPEETNLAPLSGCEPNSLHRPVVALCLPPANFLDRFAVNHKKHPEDQQTAKSVSERTRAHDSSMNPINVQMSFHLAEAADPRGRPTMSACRDGSRRRSYPDRRQVRTSRELVRLLRSGGPPGLATFAAPSACNSPGRACSERETLTHEITKRRYVHSAGIDFCRIAFMPANIARPGLPAFAARGSCHGRSRRPDGGRRHRNSVCRICCKCQ